MMLSIYRVTHTSLIPSKMQKEELLMLEYQLTFKIFSITVRIKKGICELIEVWIKSRNQNDIRTVYFARGSSCIKIVNGVSGPVPELNTDHEKAETKIAYFVQHALRENDDHALINRTRGPYQEIFVLTFKVYRPNAVRSMRLER